MARQEGQLLEDDELCPGGSLQHHPCPSAVFASWASPLLGAGGAGALGGTGWVTAGTWGTLGQPREQPPALRGARCERGSVWWCQSPAGFHCPGEKMERPFTCCCSH